MREILFKAKPCYTGGIKSAWVYGTFQYIAQRRMNPNATDNGTLEPRTDKGRIVDLYGTETEVLCDTLGQFTGLLDKHGKRVFEGDILRVKEYKNLCWDMSKSQEERDEMMRTFALDDLKGELDKEYISAVAVEEGTYCLSSNGDYNDMYLSCLFGDMNGSLPIFDFEVIGNIHDDPELIECK